MQNATLSELSRALSSKAISSEELVHDRLALAKQLNPSLNCLITICEEFAISAARAADKRRQEHTETLLTGIPFVHKDIFCTRDIKTTCASRMLDNFISPYDAAIAEQLNAAGMVLIGKANMDEFAMGSSTESSFYGPSKNPWDLDRVPGGSSGGSAVAVAAGIVPVATGSDTGGSIRQPAAFCGITGLKPTYGRVSRYGMVAYASSLDQAGPMARSAEDAALLLATMAGFDQRDATSSARPVDDYLTPLRADISGLKIGIPKYYFTGLSDAMTNVIRSALAELEDLGAQCIEIDLPHAEFAIPAYYVVALAECSSNLARFDGVRYGYRCEDPRDLDDLYCRTRSEGFGEEVIRRILLGSYVLSAGYYEAYYLKAQKIRQLICDDFAAAFEKVDVIAGPTSPTPAFRMGELIDDPVNMYLSDVYTVSANLAGLPAISIPAGLLADLPVGLQIMGPHFSEATLLNIAHRFQQVTDWHQRPPRVLSSQLLSAS